MFSGVHNGVTTLSFPQLWTIFFLLLRQSNVCAYGFKPISSQAYRYRKLNKIGNRMALKKGLYLERKEENGVGLEKTGIRVSFLCSIQMFLYINSLQSGEQIPQEVVEMIHIV